MLKKIAVASAISVGLVGCASTPTSLQPKKIEDARIYIIRDQSTLLLPENLPKSVWFKGKCLATLNNQTHTYVDVPGDNYYIFETDSLMSKSKLKIYAQAGKTYYLSQEFTNYVVGYSGSLTLNLGVGANTRVANTTFVSSQSCK